MVAEEEEEEDGEICVNVSTVVGIDNVAGEDVECVVLDSSLDATISDVDLHERERI